MKRHQCLIKSLDMPKKEVSLKTCQQKLPKLKYKGKDTKNKKKRTKVLQTFHEAGKKKKKIKVRYYIKNGLQGH